MNLPTTLRGEAHVRLQAMLCGEPPGAVLGEDLAAALLDVLAAHDPGIPEALADESGESDLADALAELFDEVLVTAEDVDEAADSASLLDELDGWLDARGIEPWEDAPPLRRTLPPRLLAEAEAVLQALSRYSDGEHAPRPPERAFEAGSRRLVGAWEGPLRREEERAAAALLELVISEEWDPWPEDVDAELVAAILARRWGS